MPTGYTAKLHDGYQSFYDFAMTCSSAFGARIMERDNAPSSNWKPREINNYHYDNLIKANEKLLACENWSDDKWEREAKYDFNNAMRHWEETELKSKDMKDRYQRMLDRVKEWEPPTSEHVKFKEFMIDQLQSSIDFDCSSNEGWKPKPKTVEDYKKSVINGLRDDVKYHTKEMMLEYDRVKSNNQWMINLINSLPKENNG